MIVDASVWVAIFRENDFHHLASVAFLYLAVATQGEFATRTVRAVLFALAEALDQPLITLDREILERSTRVIKAEAPDVWVHRQPQPNHRSDMAE